MIEQPYCVPGTSVFHHSSRAGNRRYKVSLALPEEQADVSALPVIYLLDAETGFATMVETMRRGARHRPVTGIGEAVIVGISRDCATSSRPQARREDFLSDARDFRQFIAEDIGALLEDSGVRGLRRAMVGHSLGALFLLEWMAQDDIPFDTNIPFDTGVAISPALWAGHGELAARLVRKADRDLRIWIGVGSREQGEATQDQARLARQQQRAMVDRASELGHCLAENWGRERTVFSILDGEDHASVVTASMARCLRFIFSRESGIGSSL